MANQPKKYQKFVATAATATLVATAVVPAASADTKFSDIATYATEVQEEVLFLAGLGVINGFEDGTFKPAQNITRGQAVKMIGRFLEAQGVEAPANWATEQSFSDIAVDRTDRDLVKYAALVKEAGVFQGNGSVLNPSGFTTRENMALILDRLIGQLTGKTAVELAEGLENNVSDLANAKEESRAAIAALNALGVSNAEEFKPKNNTQRVHFASFLARMIELAEEQNAEASIESVQALSKTKVVVKFNTPVDEVTAKNFTIEGAVVNGVELSEDKTVATLDVSGLEYNTEYTVAVADVKVDGEAVDFGSQSFTTPAVTQDFELRVTAAEAEVVADGADNVVIKFELLNSLGEVDTNADNMVLEIGTTFGNLATNRVTIQDGVGQVVLSSEFSSKEMIAKVTAQVIEASTDYKDLIGKVAGETTVKFIPAASVLDPNALTFLGAESNQADRVVIYFDKPVSPATFVKTEEDGTFKTYYDEDYGVFVQDFKDGVTFSVSQNGNKGIVGLASVPGNDKAIEVILAKKVAKTIVNGENEEKKEYFVLAPAPDKKVPENQKVAYKDRDGKVVLADFTTEVPVELKEKETGVTQSDYEIVYYDHKDLTKSNILKDNATVDLKVKIGDTLNERSFTLTDARKPEFTGVTVANLRTLDLKFSEAVVDGNFSIDGIWSQGSEFDVNFGDFDATTGIDKRDTATVTLNEKNSKQLYFQAGQHSITVAQLEDFAALTDTANTSTTQTLNFNVFADLTAPTATVAVESPEQFRVTFNKDFAVTSEYIKEETSTGSTKDDILSDIFNKSLRVYDAVNKDWVELEDLTVDGKASSENVFTKEALDLLKTQKLLEAKQAKDAKGPVNEIVIELTKDWTDLLFDKDTYHNYQFKFDIEARTFENAANGIMNSSFDLNLNYEGSALNSADNTSPVINDIKQTKKENEFEVFLNEPVKLLNGENGVGDKAGDTPSNIQTTGEVKDGKPVRQVPKVLVEFQGKDANGKAVVIGAKVDGYSSLTDKDGDSVLKVSTTDKKTLQQLVNEGYDANWKVVVRSVSDDIGNTAATLTKDFSLVANIIERPFQMESAENIDPVTKTYYTPFEDKVIAIDATNPGEQDRLEVTFTKAVNFAGNDNLTSVYNWTLNGRKLSELSNVATIKLADVPGVGKDNDFETVIITFADSNAFAKQSNVVSVTKGIKSLDGTVLTGEYEVVADKKTTLQYDAWRALKAVEKINALPKIADILKGEQSVSVALGYYNALTGVQKAAVPQEKVDALRAAALKAELVKNDDAESLKVFEHGASEAKLKALVNNLPALKDITAADKVAVHKAVLMYNALTNDQKLKLPQQLETLKAAAAAAGVEAPTAPVANGGNNGGGNGETPKPTPVEEAASKVDALPAVSEITPQNTAAVKVVQEAVAAYNALTAEQKAKFPAEKLAKLQEAAAAAGVTAPAAEPTPAPVVKEDTVKENALTTLYRADSSIEGFIVRVTDAVPGLTYTVKKGDTVLASAVAEGETVTLSVADQKGVVNEANELVATDVTVSSDRVAIVPGTEGAPTKVEVKVTDADTSFEELAAGFTASLDKAATAIYTVDGQEVSVELPADSENAIAAVLEALKDKTPADLAGKTYTVTLVNPADKDKENREETVYEISFPKAGTEAE